jgi:AcrR family transcriptional regulator
MCYKGILIQSTELSQNKTPGDKIVERARKRANEKAEKTSPGGSTRDAILDVAERCFAESGYDGTSVRDIQRIAKVNPGAVFYHFGTKQALFEAVFDRLAEPLVAERLRRLAACSDEPGRPDMLEQILAAYHTPALDGAFMAADSRRLFAQIRAQLIQAHHGFMSALLKKHFTTTGEQFLAALGRALPALTPQELQWRYHIMIGAVTFTMGGPWKLQLGRQADRDGVYDPEDTAEALRQIIKASKAMFLAPADRRPGK